MFLFATASCLECNQASLSKRLILWFGSSCKSIRFLKRPSWLEKLRQFKLSSWYWKCVPQRVGCKRMGSGLLLISLQSLEFLKNPQTVWHFWSSRSVQHVEQPPVGTTSWSWSNSNNRQTVREPLRHSQTAWPVQEGHQYQRIAYLLDKFPPHYETQ